MNDQQAKTCTQKSCDMPTFRQEKEKNVLHLTSDPSQKHKQTNKNTQSVKHPVCENKKWKNVPKFWMP